MIEHSDLPKLLADVHMFRYPVAKMQWDARESMEQCSRLLEHSNLLVPQRVFAPYRRESGHHLAAGGREHWGLTWQDCQKSDSEGIGGQ